MCGTIIHMDNTVGRLQSLFPSYQRDVIIGSLLGDACLECRSKGIRFPMTARLRIHQSEQQKDYVFWKYNQLKNIVLSEPKQSTSFDSRNNQNTHSWYFHTKTTREFGAVYQWMYPNGKKVLPDDIFRYITPKALAVWFMDDGSNVGNAYTVSTHCFSENDQRKVIRFLKHRYNIIATMVKDREQFKIAIGRSECYKLTDVIYAYIIPSMIYKIVIPVTTEANTNLLVR
jgi:recombination protein RecA